MTRTRIVSTLAGLAALSGAGLVSTSPAQAYCGYYGCGYGYGNAAIAAGVVGGLALGAIAADQAYRARTAGTRRVAVRRQHAR